MAVGAFGYVTYVAGGAIMDCLVQYVDSLGLLARVIKAEHEEA